MNSKTVFSNMSPKQVTKQPLHIGRFTVELLLTWASPLCRLLGELSVFVSGHGVALVCMCIFTVTGEWHVTLKMFRN